MLQAMDTAKVQQLNKCVLDFAERLRKNPRNAWQILKVPLRERVQSKFPAESDEERTAKLRQHFASLLSDSGCKRPTEDVVRRLFPMRIVEPAFRTGNFTLAELNVAISTLPNNKATGPDSVANEVLRIPTIRNDILGILNQMQQEVPASAKQSNFVPLPKKGDLSIPGNWRGITLEQHITKLFNKLHQLRHAWLDARFARTLTAFAVSPCCLLPYFTTNKREGGAVVRLCASSMRTIALGTHRSRGCCLQAVAVLCRCVALRCPPWPRPRLNVA